MPSRHLGRCDGHHEMVDCLGLAPGVFKIDRKKNDRPNRPVNFRFACSARLLGFAHAFGRAVLQ